MLSRGQLMGEAGHRKRPVSLVCASLGRFHPLEGRPLQAEPHPAAPTKSPANQYPLNSRARSHEPPARGSDPRERPRTWGCAPPVATAPLTPVPVLEISEMRQLVAVVDAIDVTRTVAVPRRSARLALPAASTSSPLEQAEIRYTPVS